MIILAQPGLHQERMSNALTEQLVIKYRRADFKEPQMALWYQRGFNAHRKEVGVGLKCATTSVARVYTATGSGAALDGTVGGMLRRTGSNSSFCVHFHHHHQHKP